MNIFETGIVVKNAVPGKLTLVWNDQEAALVVKEEGSIPQIACACCFDQKDLAGLRNLIEENVPQGVVVSVYSPDQMWCDLDYIHPSQRPSKGDRLFSREVPGFLMPNIRAEKFAKEIARAKMFREDERKVALKKELGERDEAIIALKIAEKNIARIEEMVYSAKVVLGRIPSLEVQMAEAEEVAFKY